MKKNVLMLGIGALSFLFSTKGAAQAPTADFALNQSSICVGTVLQITDNSNGAPFAWSYTIDAIGTTTVQNPSVTFTASGVYSITLVAENGDGESSAFTQTVLVNDLPVVTVSSGTAVCNGEMITLAGSGASSYAWSGGVTDGSAFTPTATEVYTVTGTDANGCVNSTVHTVIVNALPVLTISSPTAVCIGSSITQTVTGADTFTWNTGSNNGNFVDSPSMNTTYTVIGTDAVTGCSNQVTNFITVNSLPVVSVNSGIICAGDLFTLLPSGATSYVYSGGSANVNPTTNASYTVTGTDLNGCEATAVSDVTVNALPVISVNSGAICAGESFTLVPSGANTYTISGGANIVAPVSNSSYSVSGTDANGCVSSVDAVADVTVNVIPVISVNSGAICAGDVFTITPSGAATYSISGNSNMVSPAGNSSYSVSGTSAEGCVSTVDAVASVTVNALPFISVNNGTICAGSVFNIVASGASTYTYSGGSSNVSPLVSTSYSVTGTSPEGCVSAIAAVSDITVTALPLVSVNSGAICAGDSFTISPAGAISYTISGASFTVTPAANASYSITGENAEGCISTPAVANVTVNVLPVINVNSGSICIGDVFTMSAAGANTYTYSSGVSTVSPVSNTSYSVTGTSLEGCVSAVAAIANVTVNALPVISVNSGSICAGTVFTMVATGANTYTYSNGASTVSPVSNASYSVTGTSPEGCISAAAAIANVTVVALPVVSVNSGSICAGNVFTMVATGANSYVYSNGSSTASPLSNASYSVTGTDLSGCVSAPAVANLTVVALPVISVNNGTICTGNSFVIVPTGAASYTITGGTMTVNPVANTSYSITGTNVDGCVTAANAVVNVVVNALPAVGITSGTAVCIGSTLNLTGTGAATYSWSTGANTATLAVTPVVNTTYSVTGIDANGCSNTALQMVAVNALPTITAVSGSVCAGTQFSLSPAGALTYTISGGAQVVSPMVTTVYTITGTDINGCESALAFTSTVTVVSPIIVNVTGNNAICNGGSATLTANGANTYSWNTGATTSVIVVSPTSNTSYTVQGDSATCSNIKVITLTVNQLPSVTASGTATDICTGESVTITASGAISYTWSNGNNTNSQVINPTVNTVYSVTGLDTNGCANMAAVTVNVNECTGFAKLTNNDIVAGVYPNPTKGEFTIELSKATSVNIINCIGNVVYSSDLSAGSNLVNLNNQADGIYFVQIKQGNTAKTIKVVKN